MLRKHGVVGKFVEFYGDGLADLPLADRATIANMSPEFGATCGFFPVDDVTLGYMKLSGRSAEQIALVEAYAKAQGMWRNPGDEPVFTSSLALDMSTVEASLAGPKRPQDRVALPNVPQAFKAATELDIGAQGRYRQQNLYAGRAAARTARRRGGDRGDHLLHQHLQPERDDGGRPAGEKCRQESGCAANPGKTSLAPGSKVVTDYFDSAKLTAYLEELGFNPVGYGCTTCIGNSGPLPDPIEQAIKEGDLTVGAVLSGNRNFEGRIHPLVKTNWLASPPLVVAYALAGSMKIDLTKEPLGEGNDGQPVYLKDIWPSSRTSLRRWKKCAPRCSTRNTAKCSTATPTGRRSSGRFGNLSVAGGFYLYPPSAVLQYHEGEAGSGAGHQRRAHSGDSGRFGDHRPHLAGG